MKTYFQTLGLFISLLVLMLPVAFAAEINLEYDANGNLIRDGTQYRVYNSLNQLTKVYNGSSEAGNLLVEYDYHPTEERVLEKKVYLANGSLKETVYYPFAEMVRVVNRTGTFDTVHVSHEGQRIAELKSDGSKVYLHSDHLGSTSVVSDASWNSIENTSYSPYGVILDSNSETRYSYEGQEFDSTVSDYDFPP
ncbi:MAG: hypothetical protein O2779_02835 [Nanoarchaeota archaeon]|nr:hypothetical protein [Nanoarchaeota archaeon]